MIFHGVLRSCGRSSFLYLRFDDFLGQDICLMDRWQLFMMVSSIGDHIEWLLFVCMIALELNDLLRVRSLHLFAWLNGRVMRRLVVL